MNFGDFFSNIFLIKKYMYVIENADELKTTV